jgi:hypothetical protein
MRKSIIAGLTLWAALALAGQQAQAQQAQDANVANAKNDKAANDKHARAAHRAREARQAAAPRLAQQPSQFRIPAQPIVRDCVHVMFPQCARGYEGLNDGTWGR